MNFPRFKVLETETHIYFLSGPYSQWHPGVFHGKLSPDGTTFRFTYREQYMMAGKAQLFNDPVAFKAIMEADNPRDQKALGRTVKGFDNAIWIENCMDIVFRGNWFTLQYCNDYRNAIVNSGDKIIVEGNPKDEIWGVALSWDDPAILDTANWKGENRLGTTHMNVREHHRALLHYRQQSGDLEAEFNVWTRQIEPK